MTVKFNEYAQPKENKGKYLADSIREHMKSQGKRFWAGDNLSDYVYPEMKKVLIDEATEAFELVLDRLLILAT